MKLGIVSDVHCAHEALGAVAGDLRDAGAEEILLAGDIHFEYRFSTEILQVIRAFGIRCVVGNHDARILGPLGEKARAVAGASRADLEFMRELPSRLRMDVGGGKTLTMVHANPWADSYDYLYAGNEIFARCDDLDTDYLILGHTHVPMVERHGRVHVINPGALSLTRGTRATEFNYAILDTDSGEVELRCG